MRRSLRIILVVLCIFVFAWIIYSSVKDGEQDNNWIYFEQNIRFGACIVNIGAGTCLLESKANALFTVRLFGPSAIKLRFVNKIGNRAKYEFEIYDQGEYFVDLEMMYKDWNIIDTAYPQNTSQPIRTKMKAIGKQNLNLVVDFVKEHCSVFKDLTVGRWIRVEKEDSKKLQFKHRDVLWEWNSAKCKSFFSLESCNRKVLSHW
jgi:hypothetical protein